MRKYLKEEQVKTGYLVFGILNCLLYLEIAKAVTLITEAIRFYVEKSSVPSNIALWTLHTFHRFMSFYMSLPNILAYYFSIWELFLQIQLKTFSNLPWLVWLSGQSLGLLTDGSQV